MSFPDRLARFAQLGTVIPCSEMTLLAGDHEPPLVVGSGEITVHSHRSFRYRMAGVPQDIAHALRSLNRIEHDPYDGRLRERLDVITKDGTRLNCGWTIPHVDLEDFAGEWIFTGQVDVLAADDIGPSAQFTHVGFLLPQRHAIRMVLRCFFPDPGPDGRAVHRMSILGTEVTFTLDQAANLLLVHAPKSNLLPLTMTENWLGEPLRILFGQLIYPRFVARGTGALVMHSVRPSPAWSDQAGTCGLLQGEGALTDRDGFWDSYARLLGFIAQADHFEAHTITQFYGEVIEAANGSRWVWALTYASAAEGLVNLICPRGTRRSDITMSEMARLDAELERFKRYLDRWTGEPSLKDRAKGAASRILETSAAIGLRQLRDDGWVTADQYRAWDTLRNSVMHGALVSPYSSAQDDKLLLDLAGLLHALTRRIIASVDPVSGVISDTPRLPKA